MSFGGVLPGGLLLLLVPLALLHLLVVGRDVVGCWTGTVVGTVVGTVEGTVVRTVVGTVAVVQLVALLAEVGLQLTLI